MYVYTLIYPYIPTYIHKYKYSRTHAWIYKPRDITPLKTRVHNLLSVVQVRRRCAENSVYQVRFKEESEWCIGKHVRLLQQDSADNTVKVTEAKEEGVRSVWLSVTCLLPAYFGEKKVQVRTSGDSGGGSARKRPKCDHSHNGNQEKQCAQQVQSNESKFDHQRAEKEAKVTLESQVKSRQSDTRPAKQLIITQLQTDAQSPASACIPQCEMQTVAQRLAEQPQTASEAHLGSVAALSKDHDSSHHKQSSFAQQHFEGSGQDTEGVGRSKSLCRSSEGSDIKMPEADGPVDSEAPRQDSDTIGTLSKCSGLPVVTSGAAPDCALNASTVAALESCERPRAGSTVQTTSSSRALRQDEQTAQISAESHGSCAPLAETAEHTSEHAMTAHQPVMHGTSATTSGKMPTWEIDDDDFFDVDEELLARMEAEP
jgi:hypothetical protein